MILYIQWQQRSVKGFLICDASETHRKAHIEKLLTDAPFTIDKVAAVYPGKQHVPFRDALMSCSKQRTGKDLLMGELGCLLSHRRVWSMIVRQANNDQDHFLVFESDSMIAHPLFLNNNFARLTKEKDMFFWGAWEGHMKLFKSSRKDVDGQFTVGIPFIKTAYCTYGYSLNKKAASLLLERTNKISHPVDQFKYFFNQDELRLGGVLPEVIKGNQITSTIREKENQFFKKAFLAVLDLKNNIICSLR
jgi:GR25 family glycosyltransferase involved in LPS biosynthesis